MNYTINHVSKEIIITKSFAKAANVIGSIEYKEMLTLLQDFNGYSVSYKTIKTKENKVAYKGLSLRMMNLFFESRIRIAESKEDNTVEIAAVTKDLDNFVKVNLIAEGQQGKYAIIKKWFLDNFKDEYSTWCMTHEFDTKAVA